MISPPQSIASPGCKTERSSSHGIWVLHGARWAEGAYGWLLAADLPSHQGFLPLLSHLNLSLPGCRKGKEVLGPIRRAGFILEAHPVCSGGDSRGCRSRSTTASCWTLMPGPGLIQQLLRAPWCTQNMNTQLLCKSNSLETSHKNSSALALWVWWLRPLKLISCQEVGERRGEMGAQRTYCPS